jgi:hypothetical protein
MNAMNSLCGSGPSGAVGVEFMESSRRDRGMAMAEGGSRGEAGVLHALIGPRSAAPDGKGVRS